MNWIKRLLGFKEKEEEQKPLEQQPTIQTIKEEPMGYCSFCGLAVFKSGGWSKQMGMLFHRRCYKKSLRGESPQ